MIDVFAIIGMLAVALVGGIVALAAGVLAYAGWIRALGRLSDHFYDENSVRRMRISGMILVVRKFKFRKAKAVWNEAKEMVEDTESFK